MEKDWMREHITVQYKGIDITDRIGLCVCNNCTADIRKEVDDLLERSDNNDCAKSPSVTYTACLTCGGKGEILGFPKNQPCQTCNGTGHDVT